MVELVVRPLADAFMQVGVFVALLVAPFGWARYRWGRRFDALLGRHRRLGPLVAAASTMPPGCGGAIIVMALYARGGVSYGAAVAALVATMGDASWVLLAADPVLTLKLKLMLLITGTAVGYVIDGLGVQPGRRHPLVTQAMTLSPTSNGHPVAAAITPPAPRSAAAAIGVPVADRPSRLARPVTTLHGFGMLPALLWLVLGAGATVSVPVTFQLLDPDNLYLVLGAVGTLLAVVAFARGGGTLADDDVSTAFPDSMAQVLRHGGYEVAFVTVWVAAAYLAWSLLTHVTGFDGSQLPLLGLAGVVVGACIGLVPGCAIQIVFAGIFLTGGMPLSTFVANTISQDGDALIPLLALESRSALIATLVTTLPALLVGSAVLLLN
jgi:hypothetical protein